MSKITESDLKKAMSLGTYSKLYLIYGNEKYLVKYYTEKLVTKIGGKEPSEFNFHSFEAPEKITDISGACDIIPFDSDYNCVYIIDLDADKLVKNEFEKLELMLEKIPEGTIVIISQPTLEVQNGAGQKKLISLCDKNGCVLCLNTKSNSDISKQLVSWAKTRNCNLSRQLAGKIVDCCGTDLRFLKNELDKLCAYVDGRDITLADIDLIITKNAEYKIFQLADYVINGNIEMAYKQLDYLFYQKEKPEFILGILSSSYIDMYRVRVAIESGKKSNELANDFDYKRKEFRLEKAEKNGKGISTEAMRKMVDKIFEADKKIKFSPADNKTVLEVLITELLQCRYIK